MIRPEYLQAVFLIESQAAEWHGPFAILTPHNPDGEAQSDEVNVDALVRFDQALAQDPRVTRTEPIIGASPDLAHQEKSRAIWGLDLAAAVALGSEYQQDAIFWVTAEGQLEIHSCHDGAMEVLGAFEERLGPSLSS